MTGPVRHVVIAGGGTAGWMAALTLARMAPPSRPTITLVESPEVGTVGVGEATLPTIRAFNAALGIDEAEFVRETRATFKLGIEFVDWRGPGHRFFHGFGDHGPDIAGLPPHQQLVRLGPEAVASLDDFSIPAVAARHGRFQPPAAQGLASTYSYAYHFDATLFAAFLRRLAIAAGVTHVQARIGGVRLAETGDIAALRLEDGREVAGDLFVDCSGFRSLLLGEALGTPFVDWSHWLPCDRALAVPCASDRRFDPFTRSTAGPGGWRWRIPLQHRTGNGHVYASGAISDDEAMAQLLAGLEGEPLAEPRRLFFRAGHRRRFWQRNCVALGLASGFVEPLESTSIQLIEKGIGLLVELFPTTGPDPLLAEAYDRAMIASFEGIRDFILLHYRLSRREGPFWDAMRAMPIPDSLAEQIALFAEAGLVSIRDHQGFAEPSWVSMLLGLGCTPRHPHPLADREPVAAVAQHFARGRAAIAQLVRAMPTHAAFLSRLIGRDVATVTA